jgi:cobalt-zinc-cadmium efflux system membrane fusion protein
VAETEATKARQKAEAARARLRALGAEPGGAAATAGSSSRFVVRSPIAGIVTDRQVTVGESVEPTTRVFALADLSEVWVVGALHDRDVAAITPGMAAVVRVQGLADLAVRGQVVQIGPQVDDKTRTLPVRVAVRNQALPRKGGGWALRPGMFATIDLETSRKAAAVLVPTAAVQTLGGQDVVFVETALSEGAAFQRRAVKLGTRDDKTVEVTDGLAAGEKVVVANAYLLKSEFERSKIGHGHAH